MNGPDSISDPVAHRLCSTESYPSSRGSARLQNGSSQLGSARGWWCGRWDPQWWRVWWLDVGVLLTVWWHGMLTGRWRAWWLGTDMHADCVYWRHDYVMMTSSLSGSGTWVGSTGIWVGSAHSGEEDAWGASALVGRCPAGEWWRVWPCPMSDFDVVFTSGFVSASSTQWYGQNTILTTFIFEQNQTPL
jgi:hypothetical protein